MSGAPASSGVTASEAAIVRQNVLRVWSVLRRRWWAPVAGALAMLLVLGAYALLKPPRFKASGLIQLGLYVNATADPKERLPLTGEVAETHRNLLTSHAVVETALRALRRELVQGPGRREQREEFLDGIAISPIPRTYLIEVTARGKDPRDVVDRVNALMDAFIPFTNDFLGSSAVVLERNLTRKEARILERLAEVEAREQAFYREHGDIQFAHRRETLAASLQDLRRRSTAIQLERAQLDAERTRLDEHVEEPDETELDALAEFLRSPALIGRRDLVEQLGARLRLVETTLGERHPEHQDLTRKHAAEKAGYREEVLKAAKLGAAVRAERDATLALEEASLTASRRELDRELMELDRVEGEFRVLKRELAWYDAELESTRGRLRLAQSQTLGDVGARIVNRAEVPLAAEPSVRLVDYLFGLLLGFGFGVFLIVAWDHVDDTIEREEHLHPAGAAVIARIPETTSTELVAAESSWVAESVRLLRTYCEVQRGDRTSFVLLVTSGGTGDGKSFVSRHLAAAFARGGSSVLLVDGDLRRPSQLRAFGLEDSRGLADALAGDAELGDLVQPTSIANLDLLPAGACEGQPADAFVRGAFRRVVDAARERWDVVVVDAPPARPFADVSLMAPHTDGVLLVARLRRSRRTALEAVAAQLGAVGARGLGVVLNGAQRHDVATQTTYGYGPRRAT